MKEKNKCIECIWYDDDYEKCKRFDTDIDLVFARRDSYCSSFERQT